MIRLGLERSPAGYVGVAQARPRPSDEPVGGASPPDNTQLSPTCCERQIPAILFLCSDIESYRLRRAGALRRYCRFSAKAWQFTEQAFYSCNSQETAHRAPSPSSSRPGTTSLIRTEIRELLLERVNSLLSVLTFDIQAKRSLGRVEGKFPIFLDGRPISGLPGVLGVLTVCLAEREYRAGLIRVRCQEVLSQGEHPFGDPQSTDVVAGSTKARGNFVEIFRYGLTHPLTRGAPPPRRPHACPNELPEPPASPTRWVAGKHPLGNAASTRAANRRPLRVRHASRYRRRAVEEEPGGNVILQSLDRGIEPPKL